MSVAVSGDVHDQDVIRGRLIVNSLLRSLGLRVTDNVPSTECGFTYIVYFPEAHLAGDAKYLYAGGSLKHPYRDGANYFGSCTAKQYSEHKRKAAIRFVVEITAQERDLVNAAERRLLSGLDAAGDRRFWNRHNGAGAGWSREVARAAWNDPAFRAGASERARKAAATRRERRQQVR